MRVLMPSLESTNRIEVCLHRLEVTRDRPRIVESIPTSLALLTMLKSTYKPAVGLTPLPAGWTEHKAPTGASVGATHEVRSSDPFCPHTDLLSDSQGTLTITMLSLSSLHTHGQRQILRD